MDGNHLWDFWSQKRHHYLRLTVLALIQGSAHLRDVVILGIFFNVLQQRKTLFIDKWVWGNSPPITAHAFTWNCFKPLPRSIALFLVRIQTRLMTAVCRKVCTFIGHPSFVTAASKRSLDFPREEEVQRRYKSVLWNECLFMAKTGTDWVPHLLYCMKHQHKDMPKVSFVR